VEVEEVEVEVVVIVVVAMVVSNFFSTEDWVFWNDPKAEPMGGRVSEPGFRKFSLESKAAGGRKALRLRIRKKI
jgi:hypothetical protein